MTAAVLRTVLYVDDDPDICEVVQTTLSVISKLEVKTAQSGEQAVDMAFDLRPDLILMDVMMPGLDGPSTLRRLQGHALLAAIPVAFVTAKVLPEEVAQFRALGAIGVIPKPFYHGTLCEQVSSLWKGLPPPIERSGREVRSPACPLDDALGVKFLERAVRDVALLRGMMQRALDHDREAMREIEQVAHSLHGTAALFGYPDLSTVSGIVERLAEDQLSAHDGAAAGEQERLRELSIRADELAAAVDMASRVKPCAGALFHSRARSK